VSEVTVGVIDPELTRELRRNILRPHFAADQQMPGDEHSDAVHIGARIEDGPVLSTCLIFEDPCPWLPEVTPSWHLRQMATDPRSRGRGLASLVVNAAVDYARARGARLMWLQARELAVPVYARNGFVIEGGLEYDGEIDVNYQLMWRDLSTAV
jgi:GNAT superfamily N-acetyltransferase